MSTRERSGNPGPLDTSLSRFDAGVFMVEKAFNFFAGTMIVAVMLLGVAQIAGRSLFNWPIYAYIDKIEIMMSVFAFLGIAYCQKFGGHVRMEIVLKQFSGRSLWVVEAIGIVVMMFLVGVLTVYGWEHFLRSYQIGDSTMDGDYALWPSKLIVPVAFALLEIRLLLNLVGFIRLAVKPDAEPIAIPTIESVEEVARHEIHMSGADREDPPVGDGGERGRGAE